MKTKLLTLLLGMLTGMISSQAAIVVPGANGSDGALNISTDTVIDLSQAVTGAWDADNAANAGKGIYDAAKWAVVFKYSSVTVAATKTLTFINHPSRAPVVWLVSGDVTINGTVSLNGQDLQNAPLLAEGGPGGFRGGSASYLAGPGASVGFGPGGGGRQNNAGFAGSYGTNGGGMTNATYGNPSLVPLIGGSGGAGDPEFNSDRKGGGGGGGALLVASTGTVLLAGEIRANGGAGKVYGGEETGGGSGGGIRVVCDTLQGTGKVTAAGGGGWQVGGLGRIRLERVNNSNSLIVVPDPSVIPLTVGDTALIWPPADAPQVKIISIGAQPVPADPRPSFGAAGPDVALPQTSSTQVIVETTNVEQASLVKVRGTPRSNGTFTEVTATVSSVESTVPLVVRWTATLPVSTGAAAVQVKVVRP